MYWGSFLLDNSTKHSLKGPQYIRSLRATRIANGASRIGDGDDIEDIRLLRFDKLSLSIKGGQRPVQLVITGGIAMVREVDSRYWHLDISHIGNRSRNLYTREVLDLFILLETNTTAIACNQIRGNPWIGGGGGGLGGG